MKLALESIVERLRKRQMHPDFKRLGVLKMKLAQMRLKICRKRKSPPWTMIHMNKAIKSMKNNKCRDPEGLINELMKQGVAGSDFKLSLLWLMNKTKKTLYIPRMVKRVNIALIPKAEKRDLHNMSNHSVCFLLFTAIAASRLLLSTY